MTPRSLLALAPCLLAACATSLLSPATQPAMGPVSQPVTFDLTRYGKWYHEQGDMDMGTEHDESTELRLTSRLEPVLSRNPAGPQS